MFMCSESGAKQFDRFAYVAVRRDGTRLRGRGNARRTIAIRVQSPHDIIRVLVLISFLKGERFQHEQRKNIRDFHGNVLPNATRVERLAGEMDGYVIRGSQLCTTRANRGNLRTHSFTWIPLQSSRNAITNRAKELERDGDVVNATLPPEGDFQPRHRIATRRKAALR